MPLTNWFQTHTFPFLSQRENGLEISFPGPGVFVSRPPPLSDSEKIHDFPSIILDSDKNYPGRRSQSWCSRGPRVSLFFQIQNWSKCNSDFFQLLFKPRNSYWRVDSIQIYLLKFNQEYESHLTLSEPLEASDGSMHVTWAHHNAHRPETRFRRSRVCLSGTPGTDCSGCSPTLRTKFLILLNFILCLLN